ncbi:hypothetical protein J4573_13050 [Actinomadura barringtoniae]|uniref:Alkaline shock response membrane anchor protein AmaP n=1 Tax=Actinomadura barringtoniae TaxID=1427535 RepID=A0A939PF36_9ACTN|nr:hypothetical protein [Actinomadura barringtoniae]MBO2448024.1 hypothetical protein [Actinomadura barringtoniae]
MRAGIAVTGLVLLGAGVAALCVGLGLFGPGPAARPVLDPAAGRYADTTGWFWPVVAGAGEAVMLAGLVWVTRQSRDGVRRLRPALDGPTRMLARAAGGDLLRDARVLPGVEDVKLRLTGTKARPRLVMTVLCDEDAPLGEVYRGLELGPTARYRAAMGMDDLTVVVRFRLVYREARLS